MPQIVITILLVASLILFLLAAFNITARTIVLGWLGLASWVLAVLLGGGSGLT